MGNELSCRLVRTGVTAYVVLWNEDTNKIYDFTNSAWAVYNASNWDDYNYDLTSFGGGRWAKDFPNIADRFRYMADYRWRATGTAPSPDDAFIKEERRYWTEGQSIDTSGGSPSGDGDLQDARLRFREMSGRYDLVDAAGSDANTGADRFINDAQRWLDLHYYHLKPLTVYDATLSAGEDSITVTDCISIEEIWITDPDEGKTRVIKMPYREMHRLYPDAVEEIEASRPIYFTADSIQDKPNTTPTQNALLLRPPADVDYTVEIHGRFYETKLVNAADYSWWTANHMELLSLAACYALEKHYRNTQGQRDVMLAITEYVHGLGKHRVEEEISNMKDREYQL